MAVQIQFRHDTASNWTAADPILATGELGIEIDTDQFKIGNGADTWSALPYGGIVGPQGLKGDTGDTGATGDRGRFFVSTTPPAPLDYPLEEGDAWFNTDVDSGRLYMYYDGYWVEPISSTVGPQGDIGLTGPQGIQGEIGLTGPQGEPGLDGEKPLTVIYDVTVANNGTQNVYYLNSEETPDLVVYRGFKYQFKQFDSSNVGHEIYLSETQDGHHTLGGTPESVDYTSGVTYTGVAGSDGLLEWDIPHTAPDTLYYVCYNHSGMAGTSVINVRVLDILVGPEGPAGDAGPQGAGVEYSEVAPSNPQPSLLWWNTTTGMLYIYYDGFWVEAVVPAIGPTGPQGEKGDKGDVGPQGLQGPIGVYQVTDGVAPDTPDEGEAWFDSSTGKMFIYYDGFWVEQAQGNQGPKGDAGIIRAITAPVDTDILWVDESENAPSPVPIGGTTGQVLVKNTDADYDSTWANPPSPSHNYIINGAFDIWQRGTSFTSSGNTYAADRWQFLPYGTNQPFTISRVTGGAPQGLEHYSRLVQDTSNNSNFVYTQPFEIKNVIPLRGKTLTVSFFYRVPTNFSGTVNLAIKTGTGTSMSATDLLISGTAIRSIGLTNTTDWTRVSFTTTTPVEATASSLSVEFSTFNSTNSGATFDITGVQLEAGSIATPFKRNANSIQGELAACQRYYLAFDGYDNSAIGFGWTQSTTELRAIIPTPVTMRVTPTISLENGGIYAGGNFSSLGTISAQSLVGNGVQFNAVVSGVSNFQAATLKADNASYLDAEL